MSLSIDWAALAVERLDEAEAYIARDKPDAASRWALGLLDAVQRLSSFPESGRVVPETRSSKIRELAYGRYRVVYRIETQRVLILTIQHSRRRFDPSEVK